MESEKMYLALWANDMVTKLNMLCMEHGNGGNGAVALKRKENWLHVNLNDA
jgi:hypothetical protein